MMNRIVTTQEELDKAVADGIDWIEIRSSRGVLIEVTAYESSAVTAYGTSTVRAYGTSTVRAYGTSTVTAYGTSTVTAYDSSTVTAYDSSTVTAYGTSTVRAYGTSTVRAYDSSTVTARSGVAVHLHDGKVKVEGGVVIDHTTERDMTPAQWCDYHGVRVEGGIAYVYKAVDGEWTTDRGSDYSPGATPEAPDWRDDRKCGHGLHFSPTPAQALAYHSEATRFVRVGVSLDTLRPIYGRTAKCKAPRVIVPCVEVDLDMREVVS